jgi:hypothetical protein
VPVSLRWAEPVKGARALGFGKEHDMPNSVAYNSSVDLGSTDKGEVSYTWASLQAAYPNNSPQLAALPADTLVFVRTWNAWFVPNPTKTRWRPVGILTLAADGVTRTNTIDDNTQKQLAVVHIPPGLMEAGGSISLVAPHIGAGNTVNKIFRVYLNAGPGLDFNNQPTPGQTQNNATSPNGITSCRFLVNSLSPFTITGYSAWAESVTNLGGLTANTVDGSIQPDSVGAYLSVQGQLGVGGVSQSLIGINVQYHPPQSF